MKKYNYKKTGIAFLMLLFFAFIASFCFITYLIFHNTKLVLLCGLGMLIVLIYVLYIGRDRVFKKSVIIHNDAIEFMGFDVSVDKQESYKFLFSDIVSVTCSRLPFVGVYMLRVKTKEYQASFKVSLFFENHNELYSEIYNRMKLYNKTAFIDKKLQNTEK